MATIQITNRYAYNHCIALASQLEQIAAALEILDAFDDEYHEGCEDERVTRRMQLSKEVSDFGKEIERDAELYIVQMGD